MEIMAIKKQLLVPNHQIRIGMSLLHLKGNFYQLKVLSSFSFLIEVTSIKIYNHLREGNRLAHQIREWLSDDEMHLLCCLVPTYLDNRAVMDIRRNR